MPPPSPELAELVTYLCILAQDGRNKISKLTRESASSDTSGLARVTSRVNAARDNLFGWDNITDAQKLITRHMFGWVITTQRNIGKSFSRIKAFSVVLSAIATLLAFKYKGIAYIWEIGRAHV